MRAMGEDTRWRGVRAAKENTKQVQGARHRHKSYGPGHQIDRRAKSGALPSQLWQRPRAASLCSSVKWGQAGSRTHQVLSSGIRVRQVFWERQLCLQPKAALEKSRLRLLQTACCVSRAISGPQYLAAWPDGLSSHTCLAGRFVVLS